MLGLYFLIVFGLMFVHWGLVMPFLVKKVDDDDLTGIIAIFGTAFCLIPPVYLLIVSLIYVYKKGVKKYEKSDSDSK